MVINLYTKDGSLLRICKESSCKRIKSLLLYKYSFFIFA